MKKSYILTKDVKVPIVATSGTANRPAQIRYKTYRKGEIISGELKHSNNKPAFVLVGTMGVIPLNCVQEVTSIPISNANGVSESDSADAKNKEVIVNTNPKVAYGDSAIIGAIAGFGLVHLAIKYNYIKTEDNEFKLYGAVAGALMGMYIVYRNKGKKTSVKISKTE